MSDHGFQRLAFAEVLEIHLHQCTVEQSLFVCSRRGDPRIHTWNSCSNRILLRRTNRRKAIEDNVNKKQDCEEGKSEKEEAKPKATN